MGSIYSVSGRFDLAEKFYKEYLRTAIETGVRSDLVWANNNLVSHYLTIGNHAEARKYITENRSLIPEDEKESLYGIRALYLEGKGASSVDSAIIYLEKAAGLAEKKGLEELRWKCLSDLGEKYAEKKDREMARGCFDEAIRAIESLKFMAGESELQRHMLRSAVTPYERIVSLILETGDDEKGTVEAFAYMERSRARILAARLREASSGSFFHGRKEDDQEKLELISRLTYLQNSLQDGTLNDDDRKTLNEQIDHIEDDFRRLRLKMAGKGERRFSELYPGEEDMAILISTLRPDERLLSYFMGIDNSYLVSVFRGRLKYYLLPGRGELEKKVGYFLSLFKVTDDHKGTDTKEPLPSDLIELAQKKIYDLLIGPIGNEIREGERLVIVPDGLLGRLSFSLLRNDRGYLSDEHEIFYTPSLRSLYYLRDKAGLRDDYGDADYEMISFGYSGESEKYGSSRVYPFTDIPVQTLPNAEKEAEMVASFFNKSLVLTGKEAAEKSLKSAPLDKAGFLHLAAHSHIDNDDPGRSFIVLEPESTGKDSLSAGFEDGLLQWHEITSLDLKGSFVSLSACRSAGGVTSYGEGVAGLTQAFIHAGSRCVLASLTDVPDGYAERFMVCFYGKLVEGRSPASALGELQQEAREWDEAKRYPGLWASFILTGDGMAGRGIPGRQKY